MTRRTRKRVRPEQIVGRAATPVFLVSPDRRIAFFNSGCEQLTGWTADEVVGQLCEYAGDPDGSSIESLAASLCPPAEVFEGRVASRPAHVASKSGEAVPRTVFFHPLLDDGGEVTMILGVVAGVDASAPIAPAGRDRELHAELAALRIALARRFGAQSLICRSDAMLRVAEQLSVARSAEASVLIWGEPGSGKEHVARAIHYESERRTRSFVPLDCRQLTPLELEQTLRRLLEPSRDDGAALSAAALRPGTIFLSHVEQLPRDSQKLIVHAFRSEQGDSAKQGAHHRLRLIASTTSDPAVFAEGDGLRPDFYHLLTALCIAVPPLRRRTEDLRYLAQHLLEELNRGEARQFNGFGDDVWDKFAEYNWPGNVDELLTVIREARVACNEPWIRVKDLPFRFRTGYEAQAIGPAIRPQVAALEPFLARAEKEKIEQALKECRHNKAKAARLLGMTRPRLYRRMEILGISDEAELS